MRVEIEGEEFEFDSNRLPVAEGIALEKVLGMTLGEWNEALNRESALAMAGMVWLVWRRNGRDVRFKDIEDGTVPVDLAAIKIHRDDEQDDEAAADPTPPADVAAAAD